MLQAAHDGWWDWDLQGQKIYYSPRWWDMLGYRMNEIPPDTDLWRRLLHPEDVATCDQLYQDIVARRKETADLEVRLKHRSGHFVPVLVRMRAGYDQSGRAIRLMGSNTDITRFKETEQRLKQAATVFNTTREGVIVTDPSLRITMVNHAFTEISGYPEAEVLGLAPSILSSGRHDANFYKAMWQTLALDGHWSGEIWNRRRNGEVYPELLSISCVRNERGEVQNYVGVFADISKLKNSEQKADFLAHHDPLTKLPNRLMLRTQVEHAIRTAQRENTHLAVLLLDLDRFKEVNDSYGHACGDELLLQIADCLRQHLRLADSVARLGGDEFAVVLEHIGALDAGRVADAIIGWLDHEWALPNGARVHISASIGITTYPDHGDNVDSLLQGADAALYQAKQEGRACFRYATESLTYAARERLEIESRLRRAIESKRLQAWFQPQTDIASGVIVGAEALVRWIDPDQGVIPPDRFIPIAEATGLINEIGHWMLHETCRLGRAWLDAGLTPMTLAVNVSPRQFAHSDVYEDVKRALQESGYPAKYLELELTESGLMEQGMEAVTLLAKLRGLGIRLAIDDFGTGYSSLAYLKHFPLDVLKIDRSFVTGLPGDHEDAALTTAVITMGHALGFKVLAEGVETDAHLDFLRAQGCDLFQGYLCSKPLRPDDFIALVKARDGGVPLHTPA